MFVRCTLLALPLAAVVSALSVTSPEKGVILDPSDSLEIKWSSVDTDPQSFDIYLVNNAEYPTVETKLASDVDTDKGSYTVDNLGDVKNGHGYQINLLSNSPMNSGILAQSQQFNVSDSSESSSTSTTTTTSSTSTSSTKTSSSSSSTTETTDSTVSTTSSVTASGLTTSATPTGASASASASGSASGSASTSAAPTYNAGEGLAVKHHAAALGFGAVAVALAL